MYSNEIMIITHINEYHILLIYNAENGKIYIHSLKIIIQNCNIKFRSISVIYRDRFYTLEENIFIAYIHKLSRSFTVEKV